MMNRLESAARQALEALEALEYVLKPTADFDEAVCQKLHDTAITGLREALAEQAAEPISTQDDPCPSCHKGGVCKTPACGRLKLPPDHPFRSTQQAAEPVAWGLGNTAITGSNRWMMLREQVPADDQYGGAMWTPLYTRHQARKPLTDDELRNVLRNTNHMVRNAMHGPFWPELEQACRAIEAAHGITGSKT